MASEPIIVVILTLLILVAPLGLLVFAVIYERVGARRRYTPPPPEPGDDWGGTHVHRPGWWERPGR